jgi:small subunit ribosomal protein S7
MRGKPAKKTISAPDLRFGNRQLTKLINRSMVAGKKSVAQAQVYRALDIIKDKMKTDNPIQVFESAISQITPKVEVRSRRVGGASYQIPSPVRGPRGFSLSVRWLVNQARKRPNKEFHTYADKLAAELMAAAKGEGGAVAKKVSMHRQAEANRAFSHFRF